MPARISATSSAFVFAPCGPPWWSRTLTAPAFMSGPPMTSIVWTRNCSRWKSSPRSRNRFSLWPLFLVTMNRRVGPRTRRERTREAGVLSLRGWQWTGSPLNEAGPDKQLFGWRRPPAPERPRANGTKPSSPIRSRDQRPRKRSRHREGAGMARPFGHLDNPPLRQAEDQTGGFTDVQG